MDDRAYPHLDATLVGRHVVLVPLRAEHAGALAAAGSIDRSTFGYTVVPDSLDAARRYVGALLDARRRGESVPFAIARPDGEVVGSTRFLSLRWYFGREYPDVVEVGGTWLSAPAQRTAVNTEAKLLLLGHAFDVYGVGKVDLKTDARNARSIAAMERLGLDYEGVLARAHPSYAPGEEGRLRDSAMFGVTRERWPALRERLESRLAAGGRSA